MIWPTSSTLASSWVNYTGSLKIGVSIEIQFIYSHDIILNTYIFFLIFIKINLIHKFNNKLYVCSVLIILFVQVVCQHVPSVHWGEKRTPDPLDLELLMVVVCCINVGNPALILYKRSKASELQSNPCSPYVMYFDHIPPITFSCASLIHSDTLPFPLHQAFILITWVLCAKVSQKVILNCTDYHKWILNCSLVFGWNWRHWPE